MSVYRQRSGDARLLMTMPGASQRSESRARFAPGSLRPPDPCASDTWNTIRLCGSLHPKLITSSPLSRRARLTAFFERWGLFIVAGALLAMLWTLLVVASSYQRERWIDSAGRELSQLNGGVALHTDGMFRSVDTALRTMDQWLQANPHIDPRREARFVAMVDEFRKSSDGLLDLRMLSNDGGLYLIPSAAGAVSSHVSAQPSLKVHLDGSRAAGERKPFIGDPIFSPVTRSWTLPISWRLESPVSDIRVVLAVI